MSLSALLDCAPLPVLSNAPTQELGLDIRIGKYKLIRRLGQGGMGEVFEARHIHLNKRVAIKRLHDHFVWNEEMKQRFLREGVAACQIGHPNIVNITDIGLHEGVPYLVMELLEGESLEQRVQREGRLAIAEVVDLLLPVTGALAWAHERGVIHRDVKPANIILARYRDRVVVKLVDFGISRLRGGIDLTRINEVLGTLCYMAPELRGGETRGNALTDQFALAVTLYVTIAGEVPRCVGESGRMISLRALRPDVPPELERAILRAMHPEPRRRFADLRALEEALLPFASSSVRTKHRRASEPVRGASRPRGRRRRSPQMLILLLFSLMVGILAMVIWMWATVDRSAAVVAPATHLTRSDLVGPTSEPMPTTRSVPY